eukprot:TRINITY_DN12582_c0_g1_i1.p1 TRINITY_DN12582_c0_g1~~TRINITY_DN12582_c0_g1_i1.p1  ORF type:complete len:661 (-),score=173.37 TRINITY_DN12582_c0_g1_i1:114-2096(-)
MCIRDSHLVVIANTEMNPIKEIFNGGPCNADEVSGNRRNLNPFKSFLNAMVTGQANVRQRMEGFYPEEQMGPVPMGPADQEKLQAQFNQQWDMLAHEMEAKARFNEEMMHKAWESEQIRQREMELQYQQIWAAQVEAAKQEEINRQANTWVAEAQQERMEAIFKESTEQQMDDNQKQETIRQAAGDMMEVMLNDPDPKFQNSKFLQFLGKLNTGEYKIQENELIVSEAAPKVEWNTHPEESKEQDPNYDRLKRIWDMAKEGRENEANELLEKLDEEYKKELEKLQMDNPDFAGILSETWQKAQDMEEQALYRDAGPYEFQRENPFHQVSNSLEEALRLISIGKTNDAILAMEAHLQKNPGDVDHWRVLGRIHQENDEDQRAVSCFLMAVEQDPSSFDTHLALGVSCTNILDEVRAMHHLNKYLLFNKKYAAIGINPQIVTMRQVDEYSIEEVKRYNDELLMYFHRAQEIDPNDPELSSALAVLHFIERKYEISLEYFKRALDNDPMNYSLWNKMGATLAQLGRPDEAFQAYHRALELKPNYVRVWVNLGIAHAFKGDYEEAARFYLNALSLNPRALHLWSYLNDSLVCLKRNDLIPLIKHHDVNLFRKEFDIISVEELPPPELPYSKAHAQFLETQAQMNAWATEFKQAEDWANEFKPSS